MSVNVYATHLYVEVCLVYGLHAVIYSSFKKINVIDRIRYITYMLEPYTHDNFHFRWVPLFRLSTLLFSQPSCNYTMNHMEMIYFSCYLHNSTIFPEKFSHQTCNTVCRQYVFVCKLLKYTSIYGLSCIFLRKMLLINDIATWIITMIAIRYTHFHSSEYAKKRKKMCASNEKYSISLIPQAKAFSTFELFFLRSTHILLCSEYCSLFLFS